MAVAHDALTALMPPVWARAPRRSVGPRAGYMRN